MPHRSEDYAPKVPLCSLTLRRYRTVRLEIVKRSDQAKGFIVLPKRWIVNGRSAGLRSIDG